MPPEPTAEEAPPAMRSISGVIAVTSGMNRRLGIARGIGGVQAIDVGQQDQAIGADHLRHARRQPIVVAIADFGGRDRIVLVDDRNGAEPAAACQRVARIEIAAALFGVAESQQDLRDGQLVLLQHFLPCVREADLADRRRRLLLFQLELAGVQPQMPAPSAIAPEDTSSTSWPRARIAATSAASVSSQARLSCALAASTSRAEPTLTTMRRACSSGERQLGRS